ncbi:hypothetical protein [Streptomyces sp. NPDC048638]|uniref:hypothetical protein n=1 Tax=Streptomyces sp. NPDC048638 TaxID=3365580 RepID=UPI003719779A
MSIDGPAALNAERVDLRGKPAFDRILRGIALLREHGIPFSVISVVGKLGILGITMPEELLEFLAPHLVPRAAWHPGRPGSRSPRRVPPPDPLRQGTRV